MLLSLLTNCPQTTQIEIGWKYYIPMTRYREKLWRYANCAILLPLPGPEASADLRHEKFILMQDGHCLGDQTQQFCHNSGFQPEISCRSVQISTVLAMIQAGLGISFIPEMASPLSEKEGIVCRSLHGLRPRRRLPSLSPGNENQAFASSS